jgi:hypothetical protein
MADGITLPHSTRCQLILLLVWINFPIAVTGGFVAWSLSQGIGNGVAWFLGWLLLSICIAGILI